MIYPNEEKTFKVKVWLDINTPNSEMGKTFIAKIATTGNATHSGAIPRTTAIANTEKATCESPSPIIELFLRTITTPINAATIEINTPTINALCIKP